MFILLTILIHLKKNGKGAKKKQKVQYSQVEFTTRDA